MCKKNWLTLSKNRLTTTSWKVKHYLSCTDCQYEETRRVYLDGSCLQENDWPTFLCGCIGWSNLPTKLPTAANGATIWFSAFYETSSWAPAISAAVRFPHSCKRSSWARAISASSRSSPVVKPTAEYVELAPPPTVTTSGPIAKPPELFRKFATYA